MVGQYYLERRFARGASRTLTDRQLQALADAQTAQATQVSVSGPGTGRAQRRWCRPSRCARASARSRCSRASPRGRPRRGDVPGRAVRFGQDDVPALHQPPGAGQRRPAVRRRRAGRLRRARRQAARAAAARGRAAAPRHRHGVPALQPVPAPTALENIIEAPIRVKGRRRRRRSSEARELLAQVGLGGQGERPTRRSCPAASSSGSRSPGRWRWSRS